MYAIVRIRGLKNVRPETRSALQTLQLDRKNHCVLVEKNPTIDGMLHQVKDHAAYGPVNVQTLTTLLEKRARLEGDKPLTTEFLKSHKMDSIAALAKALAEGKTTLKKMGIKPVFRLNSPSKGFGRIGIKQGVGLKGPLGFHESGIDALLLKMM